VRGVKVGRSLWSGMRAEAIEEVSSPCVSMQQVAAAKLNAHEDVLTPRVWRVARQGLGGVRTCSLLDLSGCMRTCRDLRFRLPYVVVTVRRSSHRRKRSPVIRSRAWVGGWLAENFWRAVCRTKTLTSRLDRSVAASRSLRRYHSCRRRR
jgi:hypothetical protein